MQSKGKIAYKPPQLWPQKSKRGSRESGNSFQTIRFFEEQSQYCELCTKRHHLLKCLASQDDSGEIFFSPKRDYEKFAGRRTSKAPSVKIKLFCKNFYRKVIQLFKDCNFEFQDLIQREHQNKKFLQILKKHRFPEIVGRSLGTGAGNLFFKCIRKHCENGFAKNSNFDFQVKFLILKEFREILKCQFLNADGAPKGILSAFCDEKHKKVFKSFWEESLENSPVSRLNAILELLRASSLLNAEMKKIAGARINNRNPNRHRLKVLQRLVDDLWDRHRDRVKQSYLAMQTALCDCLLDASLQFQGLKDIRACFDRLFACALKDKWTSRCAPMMKKELENKLRRHLWALFVPDKNFNSALMGFY